MTPCGGRGLVAEHLDGVKLVELFVLTSSPFRPRIKLLELATSEVAKGLFFRSWNIGLRWVQATGRMLGDASIIGARAREPHSFSLTASITPTYRKRPMNQAGDAPAVRGASRLDSWGDESGTDQTLR